MMEMTAAELDKRINKFLPGIGNITIKTDKQIKEWEERRAAQEFNEWQQKSGLAAEFYGARLDSELYTGETRGKLEEFVQKVKDGAGPFLINIGKVGTGKTYSAAAVMNALRFGTYLDMPELELKLSTADRYGSRENREDLMHRLAACRLLVLDEIGRFPHKRQQEQEVLFYLINSRYQNRRPTILCSNMSGEEFAQHLGEALIDRIKSRRIRIDLNGPSMRGKE